MASSPPGPPVYWSGQPSAAPIYHPDFNPDTPPPPPPKPSSHETSRRGTPLTGGSYVPYHPTSALQQQYSPAAGNYTGDGSAYASSRDQVQSPPTTDYRQAPARPEDIQARGGSGGNIPEPPSVEEGWLPDIVKDKSTTDLQSILSNPTLITALATLHPSYSASQQHLYQLLEANKALAQHVTEVETRLAGLRTATESLLLNHQSLEVSWRKKQSEMDAALAPWSPKALYQRLAAAVAEQEAVCQAVVESFLEGDHDHDRTGKASDREVTDWVRRIRMEGAKLEARREARARWDEGRVGGWR